MVLAAKLAKIQTRAAEAVKINGYYWASSSSPRRGAGTVTIEVGNANDGTGKGTITPTAVRAGSIDETFTITYVRQLERWTAAQSASHLPQLGVSLKQ